MSPRARILLFVGVLTAFVVGATLAAYAAWHREGIIEIDVSSVDGYGSEVHLEVPGALVPIALNMVPDVRICNDEDWSEARKYMPMVRDAWQALREGPDGVWVAVDSRDERVRISKKDGYVHIDVLDADEHVMIRCPLRTVDAVTSRMSRMGRLWI